MKPIRQDTGVFDAYFLMAGSVAIPARWSTCARSARQAVELDRHGVCDEQDSKAPSSHSALPVLRSVARRQLLINRAENDRLMPGAPGCAGFPHRKNAARSRIRSIDSRMTRRTGTAASMRGSSHNRCWSTAACPSIWPASRTPCGPSLSLQDSPFEICDQSPRIARGFRSGDRQLRAKPSASSWIGGPAAVGEQSPFGQRRTSPRQIFGGMSVGQRGDLVAWRWTGRQLAGLGPKPPVNP